MADNYGRPRGGGRTTSGGSGEGTTAGGGGGGGSSSSSSSVTIDLTLVESLLSDIVDAISAGTSTGTSTKPEVITDLYLYSNQALVVLAGDYKAYYDVTTYSGAIVRVLGSVAANYGTMDILRRIELDPASELTLEPFAILNIG